MKFSTILFIAPVYADFAADASVLMAQANSLSSIVQPWNKNVGLMGALNIQRAYAPVSSAVLDLEKSSASYSPTPTNAKAVKDMSSAVAGLLTSLTSKADDFGAVGAFKIAANDIADILHPTESIVANIHHNAAHDADHMNVLSDPLYQVEVAFSSAAKAFSVQAPVFAGN